MRCGTTLHSATKCFGCDKWLVAVCLRFASTGDYLDRRSVSSNILNDYRDVTLWHQTDLSVAAINVCFLRKRRHHKFRASLPLLTQTGPVDVRTRLNII